VPPPGIFPDYSIILEFMTKKEAVKKQLKTEMAKFLEIEITNLYFFLFF